MPVWTMGMIRGPETCNASMWRECTSLQNGTLDMLLVFIVFVSILPLRI